MLLRANAHPYVIAPLQIRQKSQCPIRMKWGQTQHLKEQLLMSMAACLRFITIIVTRNYKTCGTASLLSGFTRRIFSLIFMSVNA